MSMTKKKEKEPTKEEIERAGKWFALMTWTVFTLFKEHPELLEEMKKMANENENKKTNKERKT